jgi:hypothetical protein
MLSTFKILEEATFNLRGGKLFLMLLNDEGKFAVEVVNNKESFGRKFAKNEKEAELLFETLSEKLDTFKCTAKATLAVKKYFAFKAVDKILFLILSDKDKLGQKDIRSMKKKISFKIKVNIEGDSVKIDVFFPDETKFGTFTGTVNDNDLIFSFA